MYVRLQATLVTSLMVLAGCGGSVSPADFASDYADHLNQVADRLGAVTNRRQADAAAAELEPLLSRMTSLQEQARTLSGQDAPSQELQDRLKAAGDRVRDEVARLQELDLLTPKLQSAVSQLEAASEATASYAKAGALPEPETPLEEAYVEYINVVEDLAAASGRVNDAASARANLSQFEEIGRRRSAALIRIAQAGGEQPPSGAPEKYRNHLQAAQKRAEQADARLAGLPEAEAIVEVLGPVIIISDEVEQAFRLSPATRSAGPGVTVTLRNHETLQGPRHQLMTQMIKEAAGAQHVEALIDDDGTYRLVLSPVTDMRHFVARLRLGTVSDVDPGKRSLVLTVDPASIPREAGAISGAPPGAPPGTRPPGAPAYARPGEPGFIRPDLPARP